MQERTIHELSRRTRTKVGHFTAKARLYSLGDQAPYFSVTGEETTPGGRIESCGCLHDQAAEHFPELAPVILVHLATADGTPVHAVANGLYWLGLASMAPDDDYGRRQLETADDGAAWAPQVAADHFRVSIDKVREIRQYVAADPNHSEALQFVIRAELAALWQSQADAALAVLKGAAQ